MQRVLAKSAFTFVIITLLTIINIGCSLNVLEQSQNTITDGKPQETVFTVVDTTDPKNPALAVSIRLPFRVNPNNGVALAGNHAYVTTERHLHVIDVSTPQRPVYLTSLEFSDEIGKVVVLDHHLVVGTPQKIHIIDVSEPSLPVIQFTTHLPSRNPINDFDVRDAYLYVMGENNALYIFAIDDEQTKLLRTAKISENWQFLSLKDMSKMVEQIKYPIISHSGLPKGLMDPLLLNRDFLQIRTSKNDKVCKSSEFLVMGDMGTASGNLWVYDAARIPRANGGSIFSSGVGNHNVQKNCIDYFSTKEQTTLTYSKPEIAYEIIKSGKMQQIVPEPSNKAIHIDDINFMGPITDFQISDNLLYIVNANGFFSIKGLVTIEERREGLRDKFLSATPLQASHPISIAVSENYVCVLAAPEDS